jgi:hypothetical protein
MSISDVSGIAAPPVAPLVRAQTQASHASTQAVGAPPPARPPETPHTIVGGFPPAAGADSSQAAAFGSARLNIVA